MKKLAAFLGVLVLGATVFFLWAARLPPFHGNPEAVTVDWADARVEHDAIRIVGTAHYPVRASQLRKGRFGRPDRTWWLYPVFPAKDTLSREIRIMVACPREPEDLVAFEDLTVEGWALPAPAAMNQKLEDAFYDEGYSFADDYFVLECFAQDTGEDAG